MKELTVTAAIVAYNSARTIGLAIESLRRQSRTPDEIVVIDDGSADRTAETAEAAGAAVIRLPVCRGVGAARNAALRAAKHEIIVFIDADAAAHPDMIELMMREYLLDSVAGVGGQGIEAETGTPQDLWRSIFWRQTHGPQRQSHVWMLPGLCCSYRTAVLREAGGFDERFRTNGEDVDLGLRLHNDHKRLVYRPDIQVDHHRRDSLPNLFRMVFRHSRWQAVAVRKNHWRSMFLLKQSLKWIVIATGSSIKRHRSPALALLSPFAASWAVAGRLTGMLRPRLSPVQPCPPDGAPKEPPRL